MFSLKQRFLQVTRPIGSNDVGVVVWVMTLRTPEWPHGRQIIAIANDITFQAGALSPREHAMFRAAADLAHKRQLPLVYLAANSGAKVGLDQDLKRSIQVGFDIPVYPHTHIQWKLCFLCWTFEFHGTDQASAELVGVSESSNMSMTPSVQSGAMVADQMGQH